MKIAACPFCGSDHFPQAHKRQASADLGERRGNWWTVCCSGCGGNGPDFCDSKDNAIECWNKRVDLNAKAQGRKGAKEKNGAHGGTNK